MRRIVTRVLDGELVLAIATADTADGPFTAGACAFTEQDAVTSASMACLSLLRAELSVRIPQHARQEGGDINGPRGGADRVRLGSR
jgi:hypothetical protein